MSGFVICCGCNRTISGKKIIFDKKVKEKNDSHDDNSDIFKELNITALCCKGMITSSKLDICALERSKRDV